MTGSVTIKIDAAALNQVKTKVFRCMIPLAYDIASANRRHAPVLTGALVNSIRVEIVNPGSLIEVKAGGNGRVPYALRRNFENFAHPETKHYMENGASDVFSGDWENKYFGDKL